MRSGPRFVFVVFFSFLDWGATATQTVKLQQKQAVDKQ